MDRRIDGVEDGFSEIDDTRLKFAKFAIYVVVIFAIYAEIEVMNVYMRERMEGLSSNE
jgi:hypothetical protein